MIFLIYSENLRIRASDDGKLAQSHSVHIIRHLQFLRTKSMYPLLLHSRESIEDVIKSMTTKQVDFNVIKVRQR